MKFLISLSAVVVIFSVAGCTNFKKIYKDGFVDSDNFYAEVDYESNLDLILLPVEIEGETYRFLFDTGAPNVISIELSEKLGTKSLGKGRVGDSQGNSDKLQVVKLNCVSIGGVDFYNTGAIVADLNQAVEIGCLEIDGILGSNLMRYAYWKIDSKNQILTLTSNLDTLSQGLTNPHLLEFKPKRTFTPMVSLSLNDSLIEYVTYDTGSGGYVTLGRNIKLDKGSQLAEYAGYGSTGLYGSNLDTIRYGRIKVGINGFHQIGIASYSASNSKKLLGMEFLEQFVQILDWEKNQITLFEDEMVTQKFNRYPIIPRWVDGTLIVGGLNTDIAFRNLEIAIGDSIKTLNDLNFEHAEVSVYCDLINKTDSLTGDTLKIGLINGREHQLSRVNIEIK